MLFRGQNRHEIQVDSDWNTTVFVGFMLPSLSAGLDPAYFGHIKAWTTPPACNEVNPE